MTISLGPVAPFRTRARGAQRIERTEKPGALSRSAAVGLRASVLAIVQRCYDCEDNRVAAKVGQVSFALRRPPPTGHFWQQQETSRASASSEFVCLCVAL